MDVIDLMAAVKAECERRGLSDKAAIVRKMLDAARKRDRGMSEKEVLREAVDELKLAGFYLDGERKFEDVVADQERLAPTKVQVWRSADRGGE